MTAVTYLPNLAAACDRITARQRAANIAAEWGISTSRLEYLPYQVWQAWDDRRGADSSPYGTGATEREAVEDLMWQLEEEGRMTREQVAEYCPRELTAHDRHLAETPADVARSFARRWPEVLIGGAVGAAVLLAVSGWLP